MPDKSISETIVLRGQPERKEAEAKTAISPGSFVELSSDGKVSSGGTTFTVGANVRRAVAVENDIAGKDLNSAYAIGDVVQYAVFTSGQEVNAVVAANEAAISLGSPLQITATGGVEVRSGTNEIVGYALEAVNNSANGKPTFIAMEVK